VDAVLYLSGTAGSAVLEEIGQRRAAGDSSLQIQQLNIDASDRVRAALYVWDQRERAHGKFGDAADRLFADRDGLEMASGLTVARHRAQRFGDTWVADLCCGIGGDLMALAERGPCIGIDLDTARLQMARVNLGAHERNTAALIAGDSRFAPVKADAATADPARRQGGKRARCGSDYEPSLAYIPEWQQQFDLLAVKVSPALDLGELPVREEVEYVSWQGQCREAVLWFGQGDDCRRRATQIGEQTISLASASDEILRPPVQPVGRVLYDPDPALVRSHLIGELAEQLGAWSIVEDVAYLSSDDVHHTPWAKTLPLLEQVPFQLNRLQRVLRLNGWRPGVIRRRHFPIEPETLRQQLGAFDTDSLPVELVCTRIDGKRTILICASVTESAR